jgi:NDP-sugar pyrophosphorylase family protein
MQAIILLGGKGTRLNGLYPDRPKALVPISGRPFLEWQMKWLEQHGICDVHLAAGYLAHTISDWAASVPLNGVVTVSAEPAPLGTGGGLAYAEPFICTDPFLILNGDSLLPALDFKEMEKVGHASGAILTMAVTRIESSGRYGTVEFDAHKRVTSFREKTANTSGWINGGIYLARRALIARIKPDQMVSLETDVFPDLSAERKISVIPSEPPLLDMGTPDGIKAMEQYLRNEQG